MSEKKVKRCVLCQFIRLDESIIEPINGMVMVTEKTTRIIAPTGRLVCAVCNQVAESATTH